MTNLTPTQLASTKAYIKSAVNLIEEGKNEQVIRDYFTSQLSTLFPLIPAWVTEHILGGEAALKTHKKSKETTGFVDNLVGLTAIEYEGNLLNPAKFTEGYGQVRKYCASLINYGNDPSLIMGILSDTVRWHAYEIKEVKPVSGRAVEAGDIELVEIEKIDVSLGGDVDAQRLIDFLTRFLQRLGSRPLNAFYIARDLGFESPFCGRHLDSLSSVVDKAFKTRPDYADLIKGLWCSFISFVNAQGKTNNFDLNEYTREFYILTLGKLICANAIESRALLSDNGELTEIIGGDFFRNRGLENFVEYDYFGWLSGPGLIQDQLILIAKDIQEDLRAYDFQRVPSEDIFGQLMAQLAGRSQRILLGQEWTPTWLARSLVQNTIEKLPNKTPIRFIDMCCGSGAMVLETVRQAKHRIKTNNGDTISNSKKVELLTHSITGFDIDPLAVMLSKIAWVLAAKDWLLPLGTHRVTIPIYHADSLFAMTPLSHNLDEGGEKIALKLAEHTLILPNYLISAGWQKVFDAVIDRAYAVAVQEKNPNLTDSDIDDMLNYILQDSPNILSSDNRILLFNFLKDLIDKVHKLHKEGRNGIWAFILRNNYRPGLVAGQFNGLVSNPPWLTLSKIADNPYKSALSSISESLGIKPTGSSFLHLEMATIFLLRSISRYLENNSAVGCVVPEAVLNGSQHTLFRQGAYKQAETKVPFIVDEIWKVDEHVFKNRAAVLFGKKVDGENLSIINGSYVLGSGTHQPLNFRVSTFGALSVWTDKEVSDASNLFHPANFEQGADIMPRRLFFHEVHATPKTNVVNLTPIEQGSSSLTFLVNDTKQSKDFRLFNPCMVRDEYVFDVLISKLLSPFIMSNPVKAFIPIRKDDSGKWGIVTESELKKSPDDSVALRAFNAMSQEIAKLDKSLDVSINNIWPRINFRNKIGKQIYPENGYIVFTGAGGSDVCSSFINLESFSSKKLLIDQTLYWAWVETENEALYLSGMLNSEAANNLIKAFQPRGQQGERHIHELAFGITPPFNPSQESHLEVVNKTKTLLAQYHSRLSYPGPGEEDFRQWLEPSRGLAQRRSKLKEVIRSLSSYNEYSNACKSVYIP